jgi:hypothetical protein
MNLLDECSIPAAKILAKFLMKLFHSCNTRAKNIFLPVLRKICHKVYEEKILCSREKAAHCFLHEPCIHWLTVCCMATRIGGQARFTTYRAGMFLIGVALWWETRHFFVVRGF